MGPLVLPLGQRPLALLEQPEGGRRARDPTPGRYVAHHRQQDLGKHDPEEEGQQGVHAPDRSKRSPRRQAAQGRPAPRTHRESAHLLLSITRVWSRSVRMVIICEMRPTTLLQQLIRQREVSYEQLVRELEAFARTRQIDARSASVTCNGWLGRSARETALRRRRRYPASAVSCGSSSVSRSRSWGRRESRCARQVELRWVGHVPPDSVWGLRRTSRYPSNGPISRVSGL